LKKITIAGHHGNPRTFAQMISPLEKAEESIF